LRCSTGIRKANREEIGGGRAQNRKGKIIRIKASRKRNEGPTPRSKYHP
jgi:hypothetical protein